MSGNFRTEPMVMNCDTATTTMPAPINAIPANNFKSISN